METQYVHPENGAELRRQDVYSISENAALADDRTLWELLRTMPGSTTPDKLIIPYANRQLDAPGAATSNAILWGNTADAIVHVMPFRAIVGSTTTLLTSPIEHVRGMRSGYHVGTSSIYSHLAISANASGNPRWDLVYATVTPDADGDTADILVKSPTTGVVADNPGTVINTKTTVAVAVLAGTPGATPARPSLPSDGGGNYYIALAYVYVPDGFGAASTVLRQRIHEVAPCPTISPSVGAMNCAPADEQHKVGGTVDTQQNGDEPSGPNYYRPGAYLPSTMTGCERIFILLQLGITPHSHVHESYIDRSRDWRYRYFSWKAVGAQGNTSTAGFASDRSASSSAVPSNLHAVEHGFGHSFTPGAIDAASQVVTLFDDTGKILDGTGSTIRIECDTSGALVLNIVDGTPNAQIMIWLDATAQYANFGTV